MFLFSLYPNLIHKLYDYTFITKKLNGDKINDDILILSNTNVIFRDHIHESKYFQG